MTINYRRIILVCWLLWILIALFPSTEAGWELVWKVLLFPSGSFLFVWWLGYSFLHPGAFEEKKAGWLWLSVPATLLVLLALGRTNYGLACRIWLCEGELREFAEAVRAGEEDVPFDGRRKQVGLFSVYGTKKCGTGVILMTNRGFLSDSYGISYDPDVDPKGSDDEYQHIYGPWYRYVDDW